MTRHLVVDGMNVIGARPDGWWRDRDGAVLRLHDRLVELARRTGDRLTLVLDGRPLADLPAGTHDGVEVRYARRAGRDAADDRIVDLVGALTTDERAAVTVVTSDRTLAHRLAAVGVESIGAGAFLRELDDA